MVAPRCDAGAAARNCCPACSSELRNVATRAPDSSHGTGGEPQRLQSARQLSAGPRRPRS